MLTVLGFLLATVGQASDGVSPIQARIDAATAGAVIDVGPGQYAGDLVIDKSIRLVGHDRPRLVASGKGSVVSVRAADVTIEGFDIDGRLAGSLDRDSSGVHVSADRVTLRDLHIRDAFFGVYLLSADDALVERVTVRGVSDRPAGEQGSGLHVFDSQRFRLIDTDVQEMRDAIYIQASSGGTVRGNLGRKVRYGLHYMYADDNVFENNRFEDSAAGAAIMYSNRLRFRRNRFLHNRGFASVGLLLKDCADLVAEDNLIADNARGLFLEGSDRNMFRRNIIAVSDSAVVLYGSSRENVFEGNVFVANLSPLALVGRRTDAIFRGNYWSDADEPDLDGDGVRDRAFRIASVFDHLRGNVSAADLFVRSPALRALAAAEQSFPLLTIPDVDDPAPLARIPELRDVPLEVLTTRRTAYDGLVLSASALIIGLGFLAKSRRRLA